jgi:cytochrome c
MAASLEVNKTLAAILAAGIIASGSGVISRIIYHPHVPEENAYPIAVTGGGGEAEKAGAAQAPQVSLAALLASGNEQTGQTIGKKCAACHNFEKGAANKIGPHLWGVLGRPIASVSDFSYSDALKSKGGSWDYEKLNQFLTSPRDWASGTKMTFAGLKKPEERADVILYLRSLSDNPEPLPEVPAAEGASGTAQPGATNTGAGGEAAKGQGEAGAAKAESTESAGGTAKETGQTAEAKAAPAGAAPAAAGGKEGGGGTNLAALFHETDAAAGEKIARKCAACHNFEKGGANKIGPDLWGVLGRQIASVPDFNYSNALKSKEGTWDYDKLNAFLTEPREWAPGTRMTFVGLKKPEDRAAVILYLRSLSDNPEPLPASG